MAAGRPLKLPPNFHDHDFSEFARYEKHPRARVRYIGLHNIQQGKGIREVSRILSVHENTVKDWINRFKEKGVDGLKEQPGRGAKRKIPEEQQQAFQDAIRELESKLKGGRIRGLDVLKLMKEKLGIDCCLDTAYESLKRANFVWITSRSQHPDANEEAQNAFKKTL